MRVLWGVYKAEESFLNLQLSGKRLVFEFLVSTLFGIFGGGLLTDLGIMKVGIGLGTLVSSLLGANVVDIIAKKFGLSKKMEVIVSDQQLGFTEFNPREMNALEYVKIRGKITNQNYQEINRTTRDIARYELNTLVSRKKLKQIGKNRGACYVST